MAGQQETIKFLYQIFSQRFKASELQKSVDRPVKLGLLGPAGDVARAKAALLTDSHKVETTEAMLVELDVEGNWLARLAELNGLIVMMNEDLVKPPLFDKLKQKIPRELPYVLLRYGPFSQTGRLEARELQTEFGLKRFYEANDLTVTDLRQHASAWVRDFESIALPLGRRLIFFREASARHFIRKVSRQNFTIALASTIPASIPIIGFIASMMAATGETFVMTANQLKLCLQVAGMYGMEVNFVDRIRELWPVIGSGFGWRQVSRAAVGTVPVAGPAIKAIIAYSGTYAAGEGARWYYEKGRKLTPQEYREVVSRARREALEQAKESLSRLRRRKASTLPPAEGDRE